MLKLQYYGHLMWRADSLEKTLMLGKTEGRRRRGRQRMRWLNSIIDSMDMNLRKLWELRKDRETWFAAFHGITKSWTWFSDWTTRRQITSRKKKVRIIMTHNEVFLSNVTNTLFPLQSRDLNLYWTKQKIRGDILEWTNQNPEGT